MPELGVSVDDVRRADEGDRQPALRHGRRHRDAVGPALAPDLVIHPVGHVLKHHADGGDLGVFPVVDIERDRLLHEARVRSGQSGDDVTDGRIRIRHLVFRDCSERSRKLFRRRTVTDRLREEFDPGSGAPIPVVLVQQLQVGRQEGEAIVRTQNRLPDLVELPDEASRVDPEGVQGSDEVLLLSEEACVVDDAVVVEVDVVR